jgi:hypothetical protein
MSYNTYLLTKSSIKILENSMKIGEYFFQYDDNNIQSIKNGNNELIIFGVFVDSDRRMSPLEIMNLLVNSTSIDEFITNSKKLAGRFIIVFKNKNLIYVLPDACSTIKVCYSNTNEGVYVSSEPKIIADLLKYTESGKSTEIYESTVSYNPLPNDMTMYDEIKLVLPNHYLLCTVGEMRRYYPNRVSSKISFEDAVDKSIELLTNIMVELNKNYEISIPLTSGVDSRTVLAMSKDIHNDVQYYTFRHSRYNESSADLVIPQKIALDFKLKYEIIEHELIPREVYELYDMSIGRFYNNKIVQNAWTYSNSSQSKRIYLTGDISPLAKSSFGMDLPEFFATTSYLVTKTHNFSKANKDEVRRWIREVEQFVNLSSISKFDLFFWEQRCGRNVSDVFSVMDKYCLGISIFNCRELIETWLQVPRKFRNNGELHKAIIKKAWPELLDYEFNPKPKYRVSFNGTTSKYVAVRFKFYLDKSKYYLKKLKR